MPKVDEIEVKGKVIAALPNSMFKVKLFEPEVEISARLAGKVRKHRVRILPGDTVVIALSTSDLSQGRITYRSKNEPIKVEQPSAPVTVNTTEQA